MLPSAFRLNERLDVLLVTRVLDLSLEPPLESGLI